MIPALLSFFVGSKTARIVALALVATLILYGMIQWWESSIEQETRDQIQLEQQQTNTRIKDQVDEAIRNSPVDADSAIEWLRRRQTP